MTMLALTEPTAAEAPVPARLRAAYLERVAALLDGRTINHAAVRRVCAQAQAQVLGLHACRPAWAATTRRSCQENATERGTIARHVSYRHQLRT